MNGFGSDPNRLVDQPNSLLVRSLLRAGSEVYAPPGTRESVLDALGLQEESLPAMPRSRPLPLRKGAMLLAAMVVTAAAVALPLAQGGIFERVMAAPRVPPVASIAPASHALLPPTGASSATPETAETALATRDERRSEARRVLDEPSSFRTASVPRSVSRNALAAEIAALDAVRVKLRAGEAKTALGLLDAFGREFARPNLALEAEVLRIDALAQSGQREVAKRRAAVFVQNHPKGVLTGRVRRYLEP